MRNYKLALFSVIAMATGASASGLYLDASTGLVYSDFELKDKAYYVSKTDPELTYSKSSEDNFKVDSDRQRFQGFGPGFGVKLGYGWEYGALFADLGFTMGYGSHEGDDYFVDKDCSESDVEKCLRHETYELKESNSYRFSAGAGFHVFPFGGTGSLARMAGLYFGASFGFSLVETTTDDADYAEHRPPLSDMGLGLQVEVGQKWLIAGRWDTGISLVGSWDFPGRYQEGISPEDYYTVGVMIHVSRH